MAIYPHLQKKMLIENFNFRGVQRPVSLILYFRALITIKQASTFEISRNYVLKIYCFSNNKLASKYLNPLNAIVALV